jgi:hypothetical protein
VGMTGYTYLPHLHFQVFVVTGINAWTDFDTLEVQEFIDFDSSSDSATPSLISSGSLFTAVGSCEVICSGDMGSLPL